MPVNAFLPTQTPVPRVKLPGSPTGVINRMAATLTTPISPAAKTHDARVAQAQVVTAQAAVKKAAQDAVTSAKYAVSYEAKGATDKAIRSRKDAVLALQRMRSLGVRVLQAQANASRQVASAKLLAVAQAHQVRGNGALASAYKRQADRVANAKVPIRVPKGLATGNLFEAQATDSANQSQRRVAAVFSSDSVGYGTNQGTLGDLGDVASFLTSVANSTDTIAKDIASATGDVNRQVTTGSGAPGAPGALPGATSSGILASPLVPAGILAVAAGLGYFILRR